MRRHTTSACLRMALRLRQVAVKPLLSLRRNRRKRWVLGARPALCLVDFERAWRLTSSHGANKEVIVCVSIIGTWGSVKAAMS